ncbi:hypothetical protein MKX01_016905, partial [Papaver californicum]
MHPGNILVRVAFSDDGPLGKVKYAVTCYYAIGFEALRRSGKNLSDDEIEALVYDEVFQPQVVWSVGDMQVTCGTLGLSTATVKLIGVADGVEYATGY